MSLRYFIKYNLFNHLSKLLSHFKLLKWLIKNLLNYNSMINSNKLVFKVTFSVHERVVLFVRERWSW